MSFIMKYLEYIRILNKFKGNSQVNGERNRFEHIPSFAWHYTLECRLITSVEGANKHRYMDCAASIFAPPRATRNAAWQPVLLRGCCGKGHHLLISLLRVHSLHIIKRGTLCLQLLDVEVSCYSASIKE